MSTFDVAIVGGGHNALVCAGYLAGAGLSVVLLERASWLGGPAAKFEFLPGYFTTFSNSPGSLEPKIARDLELERHGLVFKPQNPTLVHPLEDGRLFVAWRERERTAAILESYAPGESARYEAFFQYVQDFANRLGISLFRPPPTLQELVRNLTTLEDQEAFSRFFFGSVRDLFEEFMLAAETKAVLGPISTVGGLASPSTPGTPMNLLMRPLSLASMATDEAYDPRRILLRGSTGLPVGGMGAIVQSMIASARSRGVILRRETPVARVLTQGGRVRGVVTAAGEEIEADIVVCAVNPKIMVMDLIAEEDSDWAELKAKMARKRLVGKAYKLVLALGDMPRYAAASDEAEALQLAGAQFRLSPSLEYLEEAHSDMLLGRPTLKPVIWGLCPSIGAPELAPEGRHIMSLNIGNAPYDLKGGWEIEREKVAERSISLLTRWIPNLPDIILDWRCIDPTEIERDLALVGANITHGDMLPWNQFWMRPLPGLHDYRSPTRGLYLSGVGTWPGNYVSGIPGHNTSHAILEDLRSGVIALSNKTRVAVGR